VSLDEENVINIAKPEERFERVELRCCLHASHESVGVGRNILVPMLCP